MKTITSILVVFCFGFVNAVNLYSQNSTIELTFTAQNNGQYVPMDSIVIENLTQGGDTTLYAPDTVLVLNYATGIVNYNQVGDDSFIVTQNYPNPFNEKTEFDLVLKGKDNIKIVVRDMVGRELTHYESVLNRGCHSFSFSPGVNSCYFLTVTGKQQSKMIKMLSVAVSRSNRAKCRIIYTGMNIEKPAFKYQEKVDYFVFNLGDELKFTTYTDVEKTEMTDSPSGNEIYTLQFDGWTPCPGMSAVTDIDGNIYNTVQLGEQCWMKENLRTTTYRNGESIPNVTDNNAWGNLTSGAYVWYDNNPVWKEKYGALYNWFTGIDGNDLCPAGWHMPSHDEWVQLTDFIGGWELPHGNMLKSCRQVNSPLGGDCDIMQHPRWTEDTFNGNYGTDDYGFSALPGGTRGSTGVFGGIGESGGWWSSSELSSGSAMGWFCGLYNESGFVDIYYSSKLPGLHVRCLKD